MEQGLENTRLLLESWLPGTILSREIWEQSKGDLLLNRISKISSSINLVSSTKDRSGLLTKGWEDTWSYPRRPSRVEKSRLSVSALMEELRVKIWMRSRIQRAKEPVASIIS